MLAVQSARHPGVDQWAPRPRRAGQSQGTAAPKRVSETTKMAARRGRERGKLSPIYDLLWGTKRSYLSTKRKSRNLTRNRIIRM